MSKGVFVTDEQVRLTGSPNVARFLAQCLYWSKNEVVINRQGWFYKSRDEWKSETWLSRYQQEQARKQLRNMGVLKERKERTNIGIRIWFWIDQALLNLLLNNLADQSITEETETVNNSDELYDSSSINPVDNCIVSSISSSKVVDSSKCIEESETIVQEKPLFDSNNGVNSTIVSVNNDVDLLNNNNNNCNNIINDNDIGNECNENIQYCEDQEAYKACHPFIYQFMKTRILTGYDWSEFALDLFRNEGLRNTVLQDALLTFINQYGNGIIAWYREHTPITVKPLTRDDLELAVLISEE